MSRTLKKKKFEHCLSSKMGRGVLAVAGGSGGPPIFDPKSVQNMFFSCPGHFFDILIDIFIDIFIVFVIRIIIIIIVIIII